MGGVVGSRFLSFQIVLGCIFMLLLPDIVCRVDGASLEEDGVIEGEEVIVAKHESNPAGHHHHWRRTARSH